ncbi:hypothetical protein [Kribbella sp. NPDC023855]|uniref:hypothetical protein n=1 Tax=Kribbella sp. NPDC023855 TaxID=3154698 RepID=UPI0033C6FD44
MLLPTGLRAKGARQNDEYRYLDFAANDDDQEMARRYAEQLRKAGWKVSGQTATLGGVHVGFAYEDPSFYVTTRQVRMPDLEFKSNPPSVDGQFLTLHFNTAGNPEELATYRQKLIKDGYRITDVGDSDQAVKGGVVLQFRNVDSTTLEVEIERLG